MSEQTKTPQEIQALEERLAKLESLIAKQSLIENSTSINQVNENEVSEEDDFEMRISQYWLPKFGISAFVIGILILLVQPLEYLPDYLPVLFGYGLALVVAALSQIIKKHLPEFFGYIIGGSSAIAYLSTLRLHYFGNTQIVSSTLVELLLLLFVSVTTILFAIKNKSTYLTILGLFLGFATINLVTNPLYELLLLALGSGYITYISIKYNWKGLILFGIIVTYISFINSCFGNPLIGNTMQLLPDIQFYFLFIFLYSAIYSLGILFNFNEEVDSFIDVMSVFIISAGGYGLFLIMTLLDNEMLGTLHLIGAIISMALAIAFWVKVRSQYSSFIFAMIAYTALSATIIYNYNSPDFFIYLGWQSLIVLATALWFKSKFIVVANIIIFLMVLIGYLTTADITFSGISFGIIALVSPRLLNWQHNRLELKTDNIRNIYLLTALIWNPYFIYSTVSGEYVGLTLLALSLFYFGMSKLLKNLKYRIMAVLTLLITVFYLMFFGITNQNVTYKIISFLSAGIVLFLTSAAYARMKTKMKKAI